MESADSPGRYVEDETDDGDVVIYDTENDDAWIQADHGVDVSWRK